MYASMRQKPSNGRCADSVKAKAAITWVSAASGVSAEVRLYDRLFTDLQPNAGGKNC